MLEADRIIEKVVLRSAGISGAASDDLLLLRTWAECLGGSGPEHFSVKCRNPEKRAHKFLLGRGSDVIHLYLKRQQAARRTWRHARVLRALPTFDDGHTASKWARWLRHRP